ncbi:phasin family protein [Paraburkholderia sp. HP33-1]|uniref:phasin family protein n=1 Tax=Paraburkholderia sp. HP33-1 TaxID=2883243 RepID=UPI001F36E70E|nr:phasin family protein [Paraburkholderia sp. HP33-1]
MSQLSDQFLAGLCALTQLNVDTCTSAFTGAALHGESVLHAQTPEQFVRRQAEMMPWLALHFAGYTRGWMDIASEAIGPRRAARNLDDGHEPRAGDMPAGMSACATGVDAMLREAVRPQVQADGEAVAEPHARDMARAVIAHAAKAAADTAKRGSTPPTPRSST